MKEGLILVPCPETWDVADEVQLSSRAQQGKVFKKHILSRGDLYHPVTKTKIPLTDSMFETMVKNFKAKVCPIVQLPLANKNNEHDESPAANAGEVIDVEYDKKSGKLYAFCDARKYADDFGKTLLGASAFFNLNQTDTKTNTQVGPTLLHVAVTNRPYVTDLDDYEEIVAASAESSGESALVCEMSAKSGKSIKEDQVAPTLDELKAALKDEHGIDVDDLTAKLSDAETKLSAPPVVEDDKVETLASKIAEQLKGTEAETKLSAGEITQETVVNAVAALAQENVKLTSANSELGGRIDVLELSATQNEVQKLVDAGRILPAQKDAYVELCRTNREMFDKLVPAEAIVKLSITEQGAGEDPNHSDQQVDVESEIARLSAQYAESN